MAYSETYRRMLNRMGYYNYQQRLIYRHLNQEGGWDTHLERCRIFILKALDYYKPRKVTILGSGWLLELPLSEMTGMTEEINLVDIIHPPEVKQQVAILKKVKVSEADVTGGLIEEVWNKTRKRFFFNRLKSLDSIQIPEYQPEEDPGLVISLNILTQLESLVVDFLKKRAAIREEELFSFRSEIQDKHIRFLQKYKSVLITDTAEIFSDKSGRTVTNNSVVTVIPEGSYREEWTWNFDLKGSDYINKRSVLKVVAIIL